MKRLYVKFTNLPHMLAVFAAVLFVFSLVASIAAGDLKAAGADESKVLGIYTLILYACSSGCDVGNAAIFKKRGRRAHR
jgi:hypothetical protein